MEKVSFPAIVFTLLFLITCDKPKPAIIPDKVMQKVYEEIKTPYKYGLVMVPPDDSKKMDCPGVFRKDGKWILSYLVYDGRGYETWLVKSDVFPNMGDTCHRFS